MIIRWLISMCLSLMLVDSALAQSNSPYYNPNAAIRQGQDIEEGFNQARQQQPPPRRSPAPWNYGAPFGAYPFQSPQDMNQAQQQQQMQQFWNQQQMDRLNREAQPHRR